MVAKNVQVAARLLAAVFMCAGAAAPRHPALAAAQPQPEQKEQTERQRPAADRPARDRVGSILRDAEKAASEIEDEQQKAGILQAIAEEHASAGDKVAAGRTFEAALQAARKIPPGDTHGRYALLYLAGVQAATGDVEGARRAARAAMAAGEDRRVALAEVSQGEARHLYAVATAQAKAGKLTEAAQRVSAIGSDDVRVMALAMLAKAQAEAGDKQAAKQTLDKALKLAAQVGPHGYAQVALAQADAGDLDAARRTAGAITSARLKTETLLAIQIKAGDLRGALTKAQAIKSEFQSGEALTEVAAAQLRSADLEGGLQSAGAVKSVYWRVAALAEAAKAQARSGDRAAAAETFKKAFAEALDVRDKETGISGLRIAAHCRILQAQAEVGEEEGAVTWAMKQTARFKALALLSIAKGIAARQDGGQPFSAESNRQESTALPGSPAAPDRPEGLQALEQRIQAVYQKVSRSTVVLFAAEKGRGNTRKGFGVVLGVEPSPEGSRLGTGCLITTEGHVLTHAHHDYAPGAKVRVVFADGRQSKGKFLGVDGPDDLSLVKLDGGGPWPAVPLGSPDRLKPGDSVVMVGFPVPYYRDGRPPLLRLGRFCEFSGNYLLSSCTIRPADSGGPLVDLAGELIGVSVGPGRPYPQGTRHVSAAVYLQVRNSLLESKLVDELHINPSMGDVTGRSPFTDDTRFASLATPIRRSIVVVHSADRPVALGLIVAADGWILTKASEVEDRVFCQLADGRHLEASVTGRSTEHDLALLKVSATGLPVAAWSDRPLTPGVIVASVGPEPDAPVFGAVGSPVLEVPLEKGGRLPFSVRAPEPAAAEPGVEITDVWEAMPPTTQGVQGYDLLTHVEDTPVPTTEEYKRVTKRLLEMAVAGERLQLTIQRRQKTLHVNGPVESALVTSSKFYVYDLGGRRTGFPAAFLHDAFVPRSHSGGPVIDVEGEVIGINIACESVGLRNAREYAFVYAIPADVVRKVLVELRKR
jgi:serine protease Do